MSERIYYLIKIVIDTVLVIVTFLKPDLWVRLVEKKDVDSEKIKKIRIVGLFFVFMLVRNIYMLLQ